MTTRAKRETKSRRKSIGWRGILFVMVVVMVVAWAAYSVSQLSSTTTTQSTATTTQSSGAPDFTLPVVDQNGLTEQKISLSSFRGKVILLEFMVPWCGHCQNMAPVLEKLYQQYGSQNVVFLSVSGAWNGATANDAAKFIKDYGSSWTYVYDSSGAAFTMYGVQSTPAFFIIDRNGQIAATYEGEVAYETFAADLTRINA